MAWNLKAEMIETCSCNMLCPCWYGVKELMIMDRGWCASALLIRVKSGEYDGVRLDGRTAVVAIHFPGPTMFDADGTGRIWIDDGASEDQCRALETILQGTRGGPMEIARDLTSTWLPSETVPISVEEDNGTVSATIGEVGQIHSERLKNEAGEVMTMQNTGFVMAFQFEGQTAELAPSDGSRWSDPEMPENFECRSGAVGKFAWSGE